VGIIPRILYELAFFLVGLVCLVMAVSNLAAKKYLPFHEQAASTPWTEIEERLRMVILALLRLSGLGFLVVALLLLSYPAVDQLSPSAVHRFGVPGLASLYCLGLALVNRALTRSSGTPTPWKGSLYALLLLLAGLALALLAR
jgi:hypothetical protein